MSLKNEFYRWFRPTAPESYKTWFGNKLQEKLDEINYAYMASFGESLFDIDEDNIPREILNIRRNILNRKNADNTTFAEHDKRNSNGIPKAIIGHYTRFLENLIILGESDIVA